MMGEIPPEVIIMEKSSNYRTAVNVLCSVGVLTINLCISFFLSPYIIRTIGVEANGFVTLANNFVMYADLVVTALNAMAARYITLAYVQKDYEKANLYYNSVFWGNLLIVLVFIVPATVLVVYLENIINIPIRILLDVKILFALIFIGFFIRTGAPNYDCGTYVTNRMDLSYIPNMGASMFRCLFLICSFAVFVPRVWFVSMAALLVTVLRLIAAGYFTHRLTPELRVQIKKPIYSMSAIKELVGSGIWSSIGTAGAMLLNGLDLLMCNLFINPTAMGILALSKTLSSILGQLVDAVRDAFAPELTISYAIGDKKILHKNIVRAMKILTIIVTIPSAGVIVMGDAFYSLWVPSQDAKLLSILTTLSILSMTLNCGMNILLNVFSTVNKVRLNACVLLLSGAISLAITTLFVVFTDWDMYAVAGVSSFVIICKNWLFVVPKASTLLGFKWYEFYSILTPTVVSIVAIVAIGLIVRLIIPVNTWGLFLVACIVIGSIGLVFNMFIILNKEERGYLIGAVKRKIKR